MQFTLPKGTEALSQHQLYDFRGQFNETFLFKFGDHVYKKDNLLFYYRNLMHQPSMRKSLEDRKIAIISLTGREGSVVDTSKIITVNDIRFIILEYHKNDDWYLSFSSDYDVKSRFISGAIEYKKPDDAEARAYLKELLQNMHFRN